MTPRQLDRELADERERQVIAVFAVLAFMLLIGLTAGYLLGSYTTAADHDRLACPRAATR